jgi:poly(3-hydroxybutyrate) depolymerase
MKCVLLLAALCLLAGCADQGDPAPGDGLVGRTDVSPGQQRIVVRGGGRAVAALVLLPDTAGVGRPPLLLAIHNFGGDAEGFAELIHAEALRRKGIVVVLPQAAGWIGQWQGPGITLLDPFTWPGASRPDDVAALMELLTAARGLYATDPANTNVVGFSQGATLALQVTRRLDALRSGTVRRLFLAAGSAALPLDASLEMPGTDIVIYQPGHNGPQAIANFLAGEPGEPRFVRAIIDAKGCAYGTQSARDGVVTSTLGCRDGHALTHLYEPAGEHAWPGQDAKFDSWLTGRGSGSHVDFTALIGAAITGG